MRWDVWRISLQFLDRNIDLYENKLIFSCPRDLYLFNLMFNFQLNEYSREQEKYEIL